MISVIIPLYNKAHTIVNTLNTVMNQSYKDFEVIIINDGSTDNGVEIINRSFNDNRIKVINQKNSGVSAARNNGVKYSSGEWVVFLDADDEWLPDFLMTIHFISERYPDADMIGTAGYHKDFCTNSLSVMVISKYIGETKKLNYFINPDTMPHLGATAIKKIKFINVGGFHENVKVSEDVCLLQEIALNSNFIYCGIPLHVYVGNVEGQTTRVNRGKNIQNRKDECFVYNNIYRLWKQQGVLNPLVPIYLKYKIRHNFYSRLDSKDYDSINTMVENLSVDVKKLLGTLFINHVNNSKFNLFFKYYIILSKIIWRLHGFPRVGEKIPQDKYNSLIMQYNKK